MTKKQKISLGSNVLIIITGIIGVILQLQSRPFLHHLKYYTMDSNLLLIFSAVVYVCGAMVHQFRGKEIPGWIRMMRFMATASVALTFVVVLTVLMPAEPAGKRLHMLFGGGLLYQHTLCPLLSIISFIFFETDYDYKKKTIFIAFIPTFIYAIALITLNAARVVTGPYFFLKIYEQTAFMTGVWIVVIDGLALLLGAFLWKRNLVHSNRYEDRKEGRRLRSLEPLSYVALYIMQQRTGAQVLFDESLPFEYIDTYIHKKRAEGLKGFGAMHVVMAAYIRMVSQYPGLNRFMSGLRIYARKNVEIVMTVKKSMELDAPEDCIKFTFSPDATVYDVYNQVNEKIAAFQNSTETDDAFMDVASFLNSLPRWLMKKCIKFLSWLDFYGKIPQSLLELSPFHGTLAITSMASLGINPVYHHLYDFGNIPVFVAFSAIRHEKQVQTDGSVKDVRFFDYKLSADERICNGYYYSAALKYVKKCLQNPEVLDVPPETVVQDVE